MPCDVTSSNWLTDIKAKLACGLSNIPVEQMVSASIGFQIEALLCKCPTILDDEGGPACDISAGLTLSGIYERLKCGTVLTAAQISWAQANIFIKQKDCCDIADAGDVVDAFEVIAAGVHTWATGASVNGSISIPGLLESDIVIASLTQRTSNEQLIVAINDFASDQIDLVLSHNGTNGTTKIAYQVLRAN